MDNLGVAMNDTAIGAYALSKGIEKSTREMSSQEKVGLAMQMFLEKTAYAAGNYAKENETLAGSLATTKAAFDNFLSGAGDADQLIASLEKTISVVSSKLKDLVPRLTKGLGEITRKLIPQIPKAIARLLPSVLSGVSTLAEEVGDALPGILKSAMDSVSEFIFELTGIDLDPLFNTLRNSFEEIAGWASRFVSSDNFGGVIDSVNLFIEEFSTGISKLVQAYDEGGFSGVMQEIISTFERLTGIEISQLSEAVGQTFQNIADGIMALTENIDSAEVLETVNSFISALAGSISDINTAYDEGGLSGVIDELVSGVEELTGLDFSPAIQALEEIGGAISGVFSTATEGIDFAQVKANITTGLNTAIEGVSSSVSGIVGRLSTAFQQDGVTGVFEQIGNDLSGGLSGAIQTATDSLPQDFTGMGESIKTGAATAFATIGQAANEFAQTAQQQLQPVSDSLSTFFSTLGESIYNSVSPEMQSLFDTISTGISNVWQVLQPVIQVVVGFFKYTIGTFFAKISLWWASIKGAFAGIPLALEGLIQKITAPFGIMAGIISGDFETAAANIKGYFEGMGKFFSGVVDAILGAFVGIKQKFIDIGGKALEGLKEGLGWAGDKISGWWETGKETAGNLISGAKEKLGIHSPSRVFRWIGEMLMQGLDLGIRDGEFGVIRRWDDIYKEMLPKKYDFSSSAIGKASSATINGIMQTAQQAVGGSFNINLVVDGETLAEVAFDPLRAVAKRKGAVAL